MKFVLAGGSGQVGRILARAFGAEGDEVVVLGRGPASSGVPGVARHVTWDARTLGDWAAEVDGADVLVNLAGRNVNCRYDAHNRREIMDSRVASTRVVGEAIAAAKSPPAVWLQSSTATIYAHRYDAPNDEATGILGGDEPGAPDTWRFSIEVAKAWERTCEEAQTPSTRKLLLRSAMTMSPDQGGVFDTLLGLVRRGLGGTSGNGRQYVSWIHEEDFVRSLRWLIDHEQIAGAVNLCAPEPLPNSLFMAGLRAAWGTHLGLPATRLMLEVGAAFLRTETELVLKSRRVVPTRLLDGGFRFSYPRWPEAARELCQRWRDGHR